MMIALAGCFAERMQLQPGRGDAAACAATRRALARGDVLISSGRLVDALDVADEADRTCGDHSGRTLRGRALAALGLDVGTRDAIERCRELGREVAWLEATRRFGAPLRRSSSELGIAYARADAGASAAGLGAPPRLPAATAHVLLAALSLAETGDLAGARARLAAIPARNGHPAVDLTLATLADDPAAAARAASRAVFATEWRARGRVAPVWIGSRPGPRRHVLAAPDRKLVVGYGDGLALLRLDTAEIVAWLDDHDRITAAAFSPGGRMLAIADEARAISIRDVATWQVLARIVLPGGSPVQRLRFAERGRAIAFTSQDGDDRGTIFVADLAAEQIVARIEGVAALGAPVLAGDRIIIVTPTAVTGHALDGTTRWRIPARSAIVSETARTISRSTPAGAELLSIDPANGAIASTRTVADISPVALVGDEAMIGRKEWREVHVDKRGNVTPISTVKLQLDETARIGVDSGPDVPRLLDLRELTPISHHAPSDSPIRFDPDAIFAFGRRWPHAVLRALTTTEADRDGNDRVSMAELRSYVAERVGELSKDRQHPTIDRDNRFLELSFRIAPPAPPVGPRALRAPQGCGCSSSDGPNAPGLTVALAMIALLGRRRRAQIGPVIALSACAAMHADPRNPCAPAFRQLATARAWLHAGDVSRALAAADAADALCTNEPGRALRNDAMRALGLSPEVVATYAAYRHVLLEIEDLQRAGRLGARLRELEAARVAARQQLAAGFAAAGLRDPPAPSRAAHQALGEALVLADRGALDEALARLDAVEPRERDPDLDVVSAALAAAGGRPDAGVRSARALFAVEWGAERTLSPGRTRGDVGLPEAFVGSPDGKLVAASGHGLAIWRRDTGEQVLSISADDSITAMAFSSGSRLIAFGGRASTVRVADVITGRVVFTFERDDAAPLRAIMFGPGSGELTATSSIDGADGRSEFGELRTWLLATGKVVRAWHEVPVGFGPFSDGRGGLVLGSSSRVLDRSGDEIRWTTDLNVDAMTLGRDGKIRVATGATLATLDPGTGETHAIASAGGDARVLWVGSDALIAYDGGRLYRRELPNGRETWLTTQGLVEPTGTFAIVRRGGSVAIIDAHDGHYLGILTDAPGSPPLRFVDRDRVIIDDGTLQIVSHAGQTQRCGSDMWLVEPPETAQAIDNPILAYERDRLLVLDPRSCGIVRAFPRDKHPPLRTLAPGDPGTTALVSALGQSDLYDLVGLEVDGIPRVIEESGGKSVWVIGKEAMERRSRAVGAPDIRLGTEDLGADLRLRPHVTPTGEVFPTLENRNLRSVSAGGGRIALAWTDASVTVTDGARRWKLSVGNEPATIRLGPDGRTLVVARPRTISWFDVETGVAMAESWRFGTRWITTKGDRVIGAVLRVGELSELHWRAGTRILPGFVASGRQDVRP
jgi:MYXO-CTERM domain-containing protein